MSTKPKTLLRRLKGALSSRLDTDSPRVQRLKAFKLAAKCHLHDFRRSVRHMDWSRGDADYWKLSSELIFQFHKIEKGLSIGGPKRFFGAVPAIKTCELLHEWMRASHSKDDPVFQGAVEAMRSYRTRLQETPPPPEALHPLSESIDEVLRKTDTYQESLSTPIPFQTTDPCSIEALERLCQDRRSVRNFDGSPVDMGLVDRAVRVAQLSPSACNRQPWKVHLYSSRKEIDRMLKLQNGNSGFGHGIPLLAIITSDAHCFFDATERNEPYLDGGLFLMSFILALQAQGLASCCLNWCVTPDQDIKGHQWGGIPENEVIICYVGIGRANPRTQVPRSARRNTAAIVVRHD